MPILPTDTEALQEFIADNVAAEFTKDKAGSGKDKAGGDARPRIRPAAMLHRPSASGLSASKRVQKSISNPTPEFSRTCSNASFLPAS